MPISICKTQGDVLWFNANIRCCLTVANGLFYLEIWPHVHLRLSLSIVFSAANQSGRNDNDLSDSLRLYVLQPETQQYNIIELPALSVTSQENGRHVNIHQIDTSRNFGFQHVPALF